MTKLCAICGEAPAGFGWSRPKSIVALTVSFKGATGTSQVFKFCSMVCQNLFVELIEQGIEVDQKSLQQFAADSVRKPLKHYVEHVGIDKPFAEYSKTEIKGLIQVVLDSYHAKLIDFHSGSLNSLRS